MDPLSKDDTFMRALTKVDPELGRKTAFKIKSRIACCVRRWANKTRITGEHTSGSTPKRPENNDAETDNETTNHPSKCMDPLSKDDTFMRALTKVDPELGRKTAFKIKSRIACCVRRWANKTRITESIRLAVLQKGRKIRCGKPDNVRRYGRRDFF
ncbi:hypothetical protein CDAR_178991 [Caerostris darwini]|uniref:Uncharacterized protein n=1 Tax=Caerostris darwini TaxID=1538125 RepID=A0AAV4SHW0_9ARAC|nr:hypothetical protein CDAR_178991 [Caerostris darwini]